MGANYTFYVKSIATFALTLNHYSLSQCGLEAHPSLFRLLTYKGEDAYVL